MLRDKTACWASSHKPWSIDQAIAHFEDALAFCRKSGYRPALLQSNNPGDRQKAMSLLASNYGAIHIDNSPIFGSISFLLKS